MGHPAGIAQLVEHDLAKVGVEGPSPFSRSKIKEPLSEWFFYFCVDMGRMFDPLGSRVRLNSFVGVARGKNLGFIAQR